MHSFTFSNVDHVEGSGGNTWQCICKMPVWLFQNVKQQCVILQGAASACFSNPTCRGFQICWNFPVSANYYQENAVIRLKAGPQAPLNISGALQNPYCSIYVLRSGAATAPNSGAGGYSLSQASNASAITAAEASLASGTGRRLAQVAGEFLHLLIRVFSEECGLLEQPESC